MRVLIQACLFGRQLLIFYCVCGEDEEETQGLGNQGVGKSDCGDDNDNKNENDHHHDSIHQRVDRKRGSSACIVTEDNRSMVPRYSTFIILSWEICIPVHLYIYIHKNLSETTHIHNWIGV